MRYFPRYTRHTNRKKIELIFSSLSSSCPPRRNLKKGILFKQSAAIYKVCEPFKSPMAIIRSYPIAFSFPVYNLPRGKHSAIICQSITDTPLLQTSKTSHLNLKTSIRRRDLALKLLGSFALSSLAFPLVDSSSPAYGILEADDDEELLEKVKADRKKRLQKREETSKLKSEAAYVQDAVYKLSEVGQAIDKNDFASAKRVLGKSLDTKWIVNIKEAFTKVSSNPEEKSKADTFTASLASLISAVSKENLDLCKSAFVSSADALENWSVLTGLSEQLKGL